MLLNAIFGLCRTRVPLESMSAMERLDIMNDLLVNPGHNRQRKLLSIMEDK